MALPEQITTREYQKFIDHAPGETKVRVSVADAVTTLPQVSARTIENIPITNANSEQSHTFPANTRFYMLRTRNHAKLQIADNSGESATKFITVSPGAVYSSQVFNATTTTIYFQSPIAGTILEAESWA